MIKKEDLTIKDIIKICCKGLGSDQPDIGGEGILKFSTICHNPPHCGQHKLYYYNSTKLFHCYTECSESFDIYELVQRVKSLSFSDAVEFIDNLLGIAPGKKGFEFDETEYDVWDDFAVGRIGVKKENEPIPASYLNIYDNYLPALWEREGISTYAMNKFNIKMDFSEDQIIIPHYDFNGHLVGIRARNLNPWVVQQGGKYMPVIIGNKFLAHSLGNNLYGINFNKNYIQATQTAIIFEGEKSVMKYEDYSNHHNNSVAVCGSSISTEQIEILKKLGVKNVVIALDKMFTNSQSEEAKKYKTKLVALGLKFPCDMKVSYIWDDKGLTNYKSSPVDFGEKVFNMLLKNKKEIKRGC